jgi:hypothetical protein
MIRALLRWAGWTLERTAELDAARATDRAHAYRHGYELGHERGAAQARAGLITELAADRRRQMSETFTITPQGRL